MIWYTVAYDSNKNIGAYYNSFVNMLPSDDDYACFIDADTIFTTSDYGNVIEAAVKRYPDVDCFTCYTNRVNCDWQVPYDCDIYTDDYRYHRQYGESLKEKYGDECCDMTKSQLFSGMFFLIKKKAWNAIGGALPTGMLRVDNDIHQKLIDNGLKLYLMKGLYVYHWHRGSKKNSSTKHLESKTNIKKEVKNNITKIEKPKNKVVIYTCITGGYDIPRDNFIKREGFDYVMISDIPIQTKSWKNIVYDFSHLGELSNVKKQRWIKTHPHELFSEYEHSIWVDGNILINDNVYNYFESNKNNAITFKCHPQRDCVYEEIKVATYLYHKDTKEIAQKIINRYTSEKMPRHYGLYETNIIVRQHNNVKCKKLMNEWWNEIKNNSKRDQFSITYCVWKLGMKGDINEVKTNNFPPMGHKK